jgi:hypothetical protein
MRGKISLAQIHFYFHDSSRKTLKPCTCGQCTNEDFSQQVACYDAWVASIESLWEDAFDVARHLSLRLPAAAASKSAS